MKQVTSTHRIVILKTVLPQAAHSFKISEIRRRKFTNEGNFQVFHFTSAIRILNSYALIRQYF